MTKCNFNSSHNLFHSNICIPLDLTTSNSSHITKRISSSHIFIKNDNEDEDEDDDIDDTPNPIREAEQHEGKLEVKITK